MWHLAPLRPLFCAVVTLTLGWAGCVRYQPAPVSPAQTAMHLEARTLADPGLKAFLEANAAAPAQWPLRAWDFQRLTLAAFYFHPSLDVAWAQWGVAQAAEITAGARPNPTVSVGPQYNVNAAQGLTPWLLFVDFDIPIETAGKRGYRVAHAQHLSQAARLHLAHTAWQARARLRKALLEFGHATKRVGLLQQQSVLQEKALQRLDQKRAVGAVAGGELMPLRVALQKARLELGETERLCVEARARVAESLGVPLAALEPVKLPEDLPGLSAASEPLTSAEARRLALHSRADVRAALAEYEAAQAALQLQVARQYPDLKLGPGYEFDQGENKFGFTLGVELPLLHQNQGPIAETAARRKEAAARLITLQTAVMSEIERARAALQAAGQQLEAVEALLSAQRQQRATLQQQLEAGAAEPLDLLNIELELAAGELARLDTLARQQQAVAQLEDALQWPLDWPLPDLIETPTARNKP